MKKIFKNISLLLLIGIFIASCEPPDEIEKPNIGEAPSADRLVSLSLKVMTQYYQYNCLVAQSFQNKRGYLF